MVSHLELRDFSIVAWTHHRSGSDVSKDRVHVEAQCTLEFRLGNEKDVTKELADMKYLRSNVTT